MARGLIGRANPLEIVDERKNNSAPIRFAVDHENAPPSISPEYSASGVALNPDPVIVVNIRAKIKIYRIFLKRISNISDDALISSSGSNNSNWDSNLPPLNKVQSDEVGDETELARSHPVDNNRSAANFLPDRSYSASSCGTS